MSTDWPTVIVSGVVGAFAGGATVWGLPLLRRQASEAAAANDIELERIEQESAERAAVRHDEQAPQVPAQIVATLDRDRGRIGRRTLDEDDQGRLRTSG